MNRLVKGPGKVEGPVKVAFTACLSDGLIASGQPREKETGWASGNAQGQSFTGTHPESRPDSCLMTGQELSH